MNPAAIPPRPRLEIAAPRTFEGMDPKQRQAVLDQLREAVSLEQGLVALDRLAGFHEAMDSIDCWDRVRIEVDFDGDVLVGIHVATTLEPGEDGEWLEVSGMSSTKELRDEARLNGLKLGEENALAILNACQPLLTLPVDSRSFVDCSSSALPSDGLTREQLAHPARWLFPLHANAIASYESACQARQVASDMDQTIAPSRPDALPRPPRL